MGLFGTNSEIKKKTIQDLDWYVGEKIKDKTIYFKLMKNMEKMSKTYDTESECEFIKEFISTYKVQIKSIDTDIDFLKEVLLNVKSM